MERNPTQAFEDSWYFGAVCEYGEAFLSGQLRRLVVVQPPGTYKSRTWCAALIAWGWLARPWTRFLVGTNDDSLGIDHATVCRNLIESEWYRLRYGPAWHLTDDQNAIRKYSNTAGGMRQLTSVGSNVSGKKADKLLLDDVHDADKVHSLTVRNSDKAWFRNTFWDRQLNFKTSGIAVIGHRTEKDDLPGELIAEGWDVLHLPEVWDGRYRRVYSVPFVHEGRPQRTDPRREGEYLRPTRFGPAQEREVRDVSEYNWHAKHQGDPKTAEGTMFPRDKVTVIPHAPAGTVAVRYWDTAATKGKTSSSTSGVLIGRTPKGRTVVIHLERGKLNPGERNARMLSTARDDAWRTGVEVQAVWIEHPGGSGGVEASQIMVMDLGGYTVFIDPVSSKGNKVHRAGPLSSQWQAGNVDLVAGPWNKGYLDRMEAFNGQGDTDDTDASSGAYNKLARGGTPDTTPVIEEPPAVDTLGAFRGDADVDPRDVQF